jgi:hypothetical protein
MFFLDPHSQPASIRAAEEVRKTPEVIRNSLKHMWDQRGRLTDESSERLVTRIR